MSTDEVEVVSESDEDCSSSIHKVRDQINAKQAQLADDLAIINYIFANRLINKVKTPFVWLKMERDKIIKGKTWKWLKNRYYKRIKGNLDGYTLSKEVVNYMKIGSAEKSPKPYTKEEDLVILNYMLERNDFNAIAGNACWITLAEKKLLDRSWQSIRGRFLKHIAANFKSYKIPKNYEKRLERLQKCMGVLSSVGKSNGSVTEKEKSVLCEKSNMENVGDEVLIVLDDVGNAKDGPRLEMSLFTNNNDVDSLGVKNFCIAQLEEALKNESQQMVSGVLVPDKDKATGSQNKMNAGDSRKRKRSSQNETNTLQKHSVRNFISPRRMTTHEQITCQSKPGPSSEPQFVDLSSEDEVDDLRDLDEILGGKNDEVEKNIKALSVLFKLTEKEVWMMLESVDFDIKKLLKEIISS